MSEQNYGGPWFMDSRSNPAKITNAYGVYITGFPRPEHVEGEDLAIRGDFEDRIVRVHWNGRVEVEQKP
jgi:hypothetical protein